MSGIIVLGMHRSGTSLVAEMVHRWGAVGRVAECLPANRWNARGYWELSPLVEFNERLLSKIGAAWNFPPSAKSRRLLEGLAERREFREEAEALLASMHRGGNKNWFWKDPRLSLLLPFWRKIWGDVRYVVCVRDPLEICLSLRKRDGLSFDVSMALWQRYMLSVLEDTQNEPNVLYVNYSRVLRHPGQECIRLARFLGDVETRASAERRLDMQKAVDVQLRHFKIGRLETGNPLKKSLSEAQRELLAALVRSADRQGVAGELDLARYALPRTWRISLRKDLFLLRCQDCLDRLLLNSAERSHNASSRAEDAIRAR